IPAGEISPGETIGLNTTLTVLADRLISNSDVYSDIMSDCYSRLVACPLNFLCKQ
ncbi:hypothetical protein MKW98_010374, partial [Papaver atlanticum]